MSSVSAGAGGTTSTAAGEGERWAAGQRSNGKGRLVRRGKDDFVPLECPGSAERNETRVGGRFRSPQSSRRVERNEIAPGAVPSARHTCVPPSPNGSGTKQCRLQGPGPPLTSRR